MMSTITIKIEGLSPEKSEKLMRLLELLAEKSEVVENMIKILEGISNIGAAELVETLNENTDLVFNLISKKEVIAMLGNLMMLLYLVSNLNHAQIAELAEKTPKCVEKSYEEFKKYPEKKMSLFEMLNIIRSPEFAALLKALMNLLKCMRS